jgi:ferredoxin
MPLVRFISANGETVQEVEARAGDCLLDVAQAAGQPLEGTCEGQMACSTCHVIVAAEDFAQLPPASEAEEDMLALIPLVCSRTQIFRPVPVPSIAFDDKGPVIGPIQERDGAS